jgi:serine protease
VLSTVNTGQQGPVASDYAFYQGTSMATPHVVGVASLMLSANPGLKPAQIESLLKANVTPFATNGPALANCTSTTCGMGILNARAAVQAALNTPAFTNGPPSMMRAEVPYSFTFTASGSPASTFSISGTLPPGLSLNSATGVLSGTPTSGGTYVLTITASNGVGADAEYQFTLAPGSYVYLPTIVR